MISMKTVLSAVCALGLIISANNVCAAKKTVSEASSSSVAVERTVSDQIDINSANEEMLSTLPGIGPKMAERISDYRDSNGPFQAVEDLLNVKGIGPKLLDKIKPLVKLS